jgi:mannosylglycerate hydrolase
MTSAQKQVVATLVSHTHWDRAWYCTFQEYRVRLVRLIDNLLDILKKDRDYRVYMLDGQMSVLDDYLEARPGQADLLKAFCQTGRILVGPWYVLADEFLVSPESLIRNLRLGHQIGQDYGGVMKIGYVPDGFGHIAQLPQILRGFGIDNAFFWRGMGEEGDRLGTEFVWAAPDGSDVTTILMPWGYHNVTNLGYGIHWGDTSQMIFNGELAQAKIDRAIAKLLPMSNTGALLLMNGIDHVEPEPRIPDIIATANARQDDVQIMHGTLPDHLRRVRESGVELPSFSGEFRWGRYSEILQGVYSTRIHLKQQNHAHETLLERYAEPLTALAWVSGATVPDGTADMLALAWRWLLLNHPHDDMYGCGIDEVHHEMAYRFSQSKQIADVLVRDNLRGLARQVDLTAQPGTPVIAFNPLGWARREVAEAVIDFEFDDPTPDNFHMVDGAGQVVAHQVVSDEQTFWMEVLKPNRKRRVRVLLTVDVPSVGVVVYHAQAGAAAADTDLRVTERGAENATTAFTIEADGGLTITDKRTGQTTTGLNHFTDAEDCGDAYTSCPFEGGSDLYTTRGRTPDSVELLERGPVRVTYAIRWTLDIPRRLTDDRKQRSAQTVKLPITTHVMLYVGQAGVYVRTQVSNAAEDHKLTVTFPTGITAGSAWVDESFLVAERSLTLPDSTGWVEDPSPLMHQRTFTDLSDGERGLAVLNRGLPSVEVAADGTVALTLLRCVGWLSRDDLWVRRIAAGPLVPTPGAQCPGDYTFEYALLPHEGDWRSAYATAHNYNAPIFARRADTHAGLELREMNITRDDPSLVTAVPFPLDGPVTAPHSFVSVESSALVLSATYRSGDALIVRMYNVSREPVQGRVAFGFSVARVALANMDESERAVLDVVDGAVDVQADGAEVVTLKVWPA